MGRVFQKERKQQSQLQNDLGMFKTQKEGPYTSSIMTKEEGVTRVSWAGKVCRTGLGDLFYSKCSEKPLDDFK